jgi:hypothetical protein
MSVRIDWPSGPWPSHLRVYPRVYQVHDDGSESEIHEVVSLQITARPNDAIRATIETFLAMPTSSAIAEGLIVRLCPNCGKEVACSDV